MTHRSLLACLLVPLLTACLASAPPDGPGDSTSDDDDDASPRGAIVIDEAALASVGTSILDAMDYHFAGMNVKRNARCPLVSLRGPLTGTSLSNPIVYVDGTRMTDTCVLADLYPGDVTLVELYPTGTTQRSGYVTHPHGLILVFTK